MPRYYCDYCDTYLTHDSPSVRKQHNQGYKHKANVRSYYQQFEEQQTQSLIDQKVKEHLGQTAAFQQHLSTGYVYRPPLSAPVLRPPSLPLPGANPSATGSPLLPTLRPPVMPRPSGPTSSGYPPTTTFRPPFGVTPQGNGLTPPSALTPPGATGVRPVPALTSTTANETPSSSGPLGVYQQSSIASVASFGSYNSTAPGIGSGGYSTSRPPAIATSGNFPLDQSPQATLSASSPYGAASANLPPGYRS